MANKHTIQELHQWQGLPLSVKIKMTMERVRAWVNEYGEDGVYVSFSGGKDSTVLLDIVRNRCGYKDVPAVFVDTGLEYPEIREFVKTFENVEWVKPKLTFKQVIQKYGYPFMSKEISESVQGARKYLSELVKEGVTPPPYAYFYDKLCGQGKYDKSEWGGYDRKYRRVRGIGEFAKRANEVSTRREQSEVGYNVGDADRRSEDKGEYP